MTISRRLLLGRSTWKPARLPANLSAMNDSTASSMQKTDPTISALQSFIDSTSTTRTTPLRQRITATAHLEHLALQVAHNLRFQHGWTEIDLRYQTAPRLLHHADVTQTEHLLRPVISGLPPQRLYVHPDEQIEVLQRQRDEGKTGMPALEREREWVLPSQLREKWSLRRLASVFDSMPSVPPKSGGARLFEEEATVAGCGRVSGTLVPEHLATSGGGRDGESRGGQLNSWRVSQPKRLLLATVDDDSTVVYYVVHDGIIKPRQN